MLAAVSGNEAPEWEKSSLELIFFYIHRDELRSPVTSHAAITEESMTL